MLLWQVMVKVHYVFSFCKVKQTDLKALQTSGTFFFLISAFELLHFMMLHLALVSYSIVVLYIRIIEVCPKISPQNQLTLLHLGSPKMSSD